MIRLITFTDSNDKLLEFKFNDADITHWEDQNWTLITSAKQKITIGGNAFIAFDEAILGISIDKQDFSLAQKWIQTFYKDKERILIISSQKDEPLFIFHGTTMSIANRKNNYAEFMIDDKKIYMNNLHWMTLVHNTPL